MNKTSEKRDFYYVSKNDLITDIRDRKKWFQFNFIENEIPTVYRLSRCLTVNKNLECRPILMFSEDTETNSDLPCSRTDTF